MMRGHYDKLDERLKKWRMRCVVICWLGFLIAPPFAVISAYSARDSFTFGLYLGITMLIYLLSGVVICLLKGWRLDK